MNDDIDLVRGIGNAFRDFGIVDADAEQLKALVATQIVGVLDTHKLTIRAAEETTGVAAADFSCIRRATLGRFTINRLMSVLSRLDQSVEVSVTVRPRSAA